jgi:hypothetical protein
VLFVGRGNYDDRRTGGRGYDDQRRRYQPHGDDDHGRIGEPGMSSFSSFLTVFGLFKMNFTYSHVVFLF